jgi:Zn-dependent protease
MGAFRLGRIAGIDILVHWSWFAIFILLSGWLAEGFFRDVYEDWSGGERWGTAVAAAILFFGSVLLHELAHSLMAKRLGLPVQNITLFVFGGVSALGAEPDSAKQEFQIAIVGPLTSVVLAILFGALTAAAWITDVHDTPPGAIVEYLAFINAAVAIFNMLPGYPLDGGRVLRAALWARSGNMLRSTQRSAGAGTIISFALMAVGVISIMFGNFIGGVWFVVIGWFLRNVSETSYRQQLLRSTLEGTKVSEVVNRSFRAVPPDISLSQLVNDSMLALGQRCVPVVAGQELLGIVTLGDLRRVPQEEWLTTSAYRAMTPYEKLHAAGPRDDLLQALEVMATHNVNQLPVLEGRLFLGFVTRADVLSLIQIRSELSKEPTAAPNR